MSKEVEKPELEEAIWNEAYANGFKEVADWLRAYADDVENSVPLGDDGK
jgi:hypothetical protein